MAVKFNRGELPIAYTMIETAGRIKPRRDGRHPLEKFFLLWTAFRQVYVTLAARQGLRTELLTTSTGITVCVGSGNGGW